MITKTGASQAFSIKINLHAAATPSINGSWTKTISRPPTDIADTIGILDATEDSKPQTAHERIYLALKERLLFGGFLPGKAVTLRGLADDLDVSPMPVRDAVRRLTAEGALESHGNRRVSIPAMTSKRYREINLTRSLLEPELAVMALPYIDQDDIPAARGD